VQAINSMPMKSTRRGIGETGIRLSFGGVIIEDGDFIYADNNGVIVADGKLEMPVGE
ncbi:MAG TPA: hypothetical protein VFW49_15175, partial [Fluviicoccus sp.]|nr:hypothetical protein [Fluviicoccus sp.]